MKTKTILKTIGAIVGWFITIQLVPLGFHLMNQPNGIFSILGFLASILIFLGMIILAGMSGSSLVDLIFEYRESRKVKQEKQE